jgi:hypothetical protein
MPVLQVSSILKCELNCQDCTDLESVQFTSREKAYFIEAHQQSKMICIVRLLKSRIKPCSFFSEITNWSNDVSKGFDSVTEGRCGMLVNPASEIAKINGTVK